jgi:hypothetical protein
MAAIVWVNVVLTLPFLIAFIGVPLWMTFKSPDTSPDHGQARAYLRAKAGPVTASADPPSGTAAVDHAPDAARVAAAA